MASDAQPNSKQRSTQAEPAETSAPERLSAKDVLVTLCVVCGDRACSHLYYGVAACHGCKCFFWRTVKTGSKYACRYAERCDITAGRNTCRFCRFNRCLSAGMRIEAVRMERAPEREQQQKRGEKRKSPSREEDEMDPAKRTRMDSRLLVNSLLLADKQAREGAVADFKTGAVYWLQDALATPTLLDPWRSKLTYGSTHAATEAGLAWAERRLLVWAIDWIHATAAIDDDGFQPADYLCVLRACFAPLAAFELASHASSPSVLLPGEVRVDGDDAVLGHSVLNAQLHSSLLELSAAIAPLSLSDKEAALLKAVIIADPATAGVSSSARVALSLLRTRCVSAIIHLDIDPLKAAERLSQLLFLLPQITLIGAQLVEHCRMRDTFASAGRPDPLISQLYGGIFDSHKPSADAEYLMNSCSPASSVHGAES